VSKPSLSQFILANMETILQRWEDFARTLEAGRLLSISALRNDAERMLRFVAADMLTMQSDAEQYDKSIGQGKQLPDSQQSAGHDHGVARASDNFSLMEVVSEYRALRSTVTSLWLSETELTEDTAQQLVRFDEAIDQILAESVVRFSSKIDQEADLFTASIGHDLRNPLNAISMAGMLLNTSDALDARGRLAVKQIELSVGRIENMLRQLGDFARVRLGAIVGYDRQQADVAEICRQIVEEFRTSHPDRHFEFQNDGDTMALVDSVRLGELLSNLLGNAIQHGSTDGEVRVQAYGSADDVLIEVHNAGPAIPKDQIDVLFEPMRRGPSTQPREPGSLGLGLYIARTIALAHGGNVSVVSTDGETTFRTQLPRHGRPVASRNGSLKAPNARPS